MLLDFEIRSCSRTCASTGRSLQPGDVYFSVLAVHDAKMVRHDYSAAAWSGPPEDCIGWWRSRLPTRDQGAPKLAPTDVMLNLFTALEDKPAEAEFRYLLGLLLLRRKVLRREDTIQDDKGRELLVVSSPRREEQYELLVAEPDAEQAEALRQQMVNLLYGDSDGSDGTATISSDTSE